MPTAAIAPLQIERFYRAALLGLRYLDALEGRDRRFGGSADARWDGFRGHLELSDRIDLLCRDASATWAAAFSPAIAFTLPGLAPDDAFGPDWDGLDDESARRLWREVEAVRWTSFDDAIGTLGMALGRVESTFVLGVASSPSNLQPTTRLLVAGLGAICHVSRALDSNRSLRWAEQVTVVADRPEEYQLAGLVASLLQAERPTRIVSCDDASLELDRADLLVSSDVSSRTRASLTAE